MEPIDVSKKDLFISQKVNKYLRKILTKNGWVYFNKKDCGRHRITIYKKTKQMLRLMGISYAIPPPHPIGSVDYGLPLKIRLIESDAALRSIQTRQSISNPTLERGKGSDDW